MGRRNRKAGRSGILSEYVYFLGILVVLGGTKAGLLIYALF